MYNLSRLILLSLSSGLLFDGKYYSYDAVYKMHNGTSDGSIRVILARLFQRGYVEKIIKNRLTLARLTAKGAAYLTTTFLLSAGKPPVWDGVWRIYIVKNNKLKLTKYGFGIVQKSVYLSPFQTAEKRILAGTLVFEARRAIGLDNKTIAARAWSMDRLALRFASWIAKTKVDSRLADLVSEYEDLIRDHPNLPVELLPYGWPARRAEKIFTKLISSRFG